MTSNSTTAEYLTDEDQHDDHYQDLLDSKTLLEEGRTASGLVLSEEEYERWLQRDRRKVLTGEDHEVKSPAYMTRGVIVSEREGEEWRRDHVKGYDTNLWSLGSVETTPECPSENKQVQSRKESQVGKPTRETLIEEKQKLDRLITLKEYQLKEQHKSVNSDMPNIKSLLAEKQHLTRLRFMREMQLKEKAHEDWRKMNVKQKLKKKKSRQELLTADLRKISGHHLPERSHPDNTQTQYRIDVDQRREAELLNKYDDNRELHRISPQYTTPTHNEENFVLLHIYLMMNA